MTFWSILFIVIGILIIAFMLFAAIAGNDDNEFIGCGCGCGFWFIIVGVIMLFAFVIGAGSIVILK